METEESPGALTFQERARACVWSLQYQGFTREQALEFMLLRWLYFCTPRMD